MLTSYTLLCALFIAALLPATFAAGGCTAVGTHSIIATAQADTYVSLQYPSDNYGTQNTISLQAAGKSWAKNAYVRFDVADSSISTLLGDSCQFKLSHATLHVKTSSQVVPDLTVWSTAASTAAWDQTTLTASNAPPLGTELDTIATTATETWYSLDVTAGLGAEYTQVTAANNLPDPNARPNIAGGLVSRIQHTGPRRSNLWLNQQQALLLP